MQNTWKTPSRRYDWPLSNIFYSRTCNNPDGGLLTNDWCLTPLSWFTVRVSDIVRTRSPTNERSSLTRLLSAVARADSHVRHPSVARFPLLVTLRAMHAVHVGTGPQAIRGRRYRRPGLAGQSTELSRARTNYRGDSSTNRQYRRSRGRHDPPIGSIVSPLPGDVARCPERLPVSR